jgi:4a-hydroxytetrahydrobiopterin dehydratase
MHTARRETNPPVIDVSLCTHEDGLWVTQKDIDMARRISEIARQKGLEPEPSR